MSRTTDLSPAAAATLSPGIAALMNRARAQGAADGRTDAKGNVHRYASTARYADAIAHLGAPEGWTDADRAEARAAWIACGCTRGAR